MEEGIEMMKKVVSCIIGFIPFGKLRILLWRVLLGYRISFDSKIGYGNFIACNKVLIKSGTIGHFNRIFANSLVMHEGSDIWRFNLIKLVNEFNMDKDSHVRSRNSIVGLFRDSNPKREKCNFYIGEHSIITIRHSLDCTDEIYIGNNVVFGGKDTQVWTHGFDINRNMVTGKIVFGDNIYVGSRCTICQSVSVCGNTVIGAATCVSRSIEETGFYVSNQLIKKSAIQDYAMNNSGL